MKKKLALALGMVLLCLWTTACFAETGETLADLYVNTELPDTYLNILFLGIDSEDGQTRSDAMMILSIHKTEGMIKVTSIARDTYIPFPDSTTEDRINTAYRYGGETLAMQVVNLSFGMNIQHYITMTFDGMRNIIDLLEGVDIELTADEAAAVRDASSEPEDIGGGNYHLTGEQALALVRIRKLDNDFGRTSRQRRILQAMFNKMREDFTLEGAIATLEACLPYMETNMGVWEFVSLALALLPEDENGELQLDGLTMEELSLPETGGYSFEDVDGKSVITLTDKQWDDAKQALYSFVYGDDG